MAERRVPEAVRLRLSVVIPTLNEAVYLPNLLDALAVQTRPADEIVVADAGSTDGTPDIARRYGARVVKGGTPAVGRNAGAGIATGDLLLFLDADVVPPPDFIEHAVAEFLRKGYDVATARVVPWDGSLLERVAHDMANLYFILMQPVLPYAPGFCILVRRSLHEKIGGFDETLWMSEDIDYVRRAARCGRFGVLTSTCIPVSMRRFRKEGMLRTGAKYLWCEMQMLRGKPVRKIPFKYEFGAFPPPARHQSRRHFRVLAVPLPLEVVQQMLQGKSTHRKEREEKSAQPPRFKNSTDPMKTLFGKESRENPVDWSLRQRRAECNGRVDPPGASGPVL
ncbi:MAG: glycosyltransferase [Thermoflexales bacterium]|nr:glycosyltransferase [Thermoflexales bacterium]